MAKRVNVDLPMQTREAVIVPASLNVESRTVDLVWSTGAAVRRYDYWEGQYYDEVLDMSPDAVDLSRLNAGAPLLNSHQAYDLSAILGVVVDGTASVDGKQGVATVRFSDRADVEPIFQDVKAGIIRNISVGYAASKYEITEQQGQVPVYRATAWQPMELSLVPIPADAGAGVRSQSPVSPANPGRAFPCALIRSNPKETTTMKTPEQIAEEARIAAEAETQRLADEAAATRAAETAAAAPKAPTTAELRSLGLALRIENVDAFIVRSIESKKSMKEIRKEEIDRAAAEQAKAQPVTGITITRDEAETKRAALSEYLRHRSDPGSVKLDKGAQFRGMSFIEIARECVEDSGIKTRGMSKLDIATHAMNLHLAQPGYTRAGPGEGISDLTNITLDAANKTLRQAYENSAQTFKAVMRQSSAPDFKNINRIAMSGAPSLLAVTENGEIKRGFVSDAKEVYSLGTYARILPLTRKAIINDDMDAFGRLPMLMGRAAADLESDTAWAIVTVNANMADGVALFHATHANLATGAGITATSLGLMQNLLRQQTGPEGRLLNLVGKTLVLPSALELLGRQITSPQYQPTKQGDINPYLFQPLIEPRLDATSPSNWYLFADYNQIDTIEYAYLEGQEGAYMESRIGFDVDGMEMKVRLDFGAKAIDWRGMAKNPN